ncbi:MAG TPA: hypothetical protein VFN61_14985 [Acidimicrobiales bacterium]|nr:hypothetical protein [Acidimicrobiales bacterium]
MPTERIYQVPDDEREEEIQDAWVRETDEQEVRGVEAWKPFDGDWRVVLWVAEFLREDPLEAEMRRSMHSALSQCSGVDQVIEEDREQWVVTGSPSGLDLVRAAAEVVDALADRARAYLDAL